MNHKRIFERGATLSDDRRHRFSLTRRWDTEGPEFVFVGLNPSTADEENDDPTIRRLVDFARQRDCASLAVVNLYSRITPHPAYLQRLRSDDRGDSPTNDAAIQAATHGSGTRFVVLGWGAHGHNFEERVEHVLVQLAHLDLLCFGTTSTRQPKHPLYLARSTPLTLYRTSSPPPE